MSELKTLEELPEARSFTSLATISLANPHVLHPDACNPAMDLVALLHEHESGDGGPAGSAGKPFDAKGKGKAGQGMITTVVLWRLSGSKVWEVDVTGRVLGLAWSADGLYLTLLVLRLDQWPPAHDSPNATASTIEHLSVHTGEVVKAVRTPPRLLAAVSAEDWDLATSRTARYQWWSLAWTAADAEWPTPAPGSSLTIIDSLPRVTPVEPPKPAILNPFAPPAKDKSKDKGLHSKLGGCSVLMPAPAPLPPSSLVVASPSRAGLRDTERFLTGTFLLPAGVPDPLSESVLGLALRADKITNLLNVIVRGFESIQAVVKDGEKQTFLWRDELEICGEQQGMSVSDVHADLFRFLMTGRSGPAVSEWLGNRLANRAVTKWESTLSTEFTTVQNIVSQSVAPALERVLLILEELSGCFREDAGPSFSMDRDAIDRARSLTRGLLALAEDMRQTATLEWSASMEWFKWIRYEMARSVSDEGGPIASYDLKLVWSFMKNGFVSSRFKLYFPDDPSAKDDVLSSDVLRKPTPAARDLNKIMAATLSKLLAQPGAAEPIGSPPQQPDYSFSPTRVSPARARSPQVASSPDTVGDASMAREEATAADRQSELEPWAWTNSLIAACNELVTSARPLRSAAPSESGQGVMAEVSVLSQRVIEDEHWSLAENPPAKLLVARGSGETHNMRQAHFEIPDGEILQAAFFDDEEVAVIFQHGGQRYLSAVQVSAIAERLHSGSELSNAHQLPVSRARPIGKARPEAHAAWQMALNGNAGRRSGWVLTHGGTELEVFDMEGNEDDEEEEEEGEDAMDTE